MRRGGWLYFHIYRGVFSIDYVCMVVVRVGSGRFVGCVFYILCVYCRVSYVL